MALPRTQENGSASTSILEMRNIAKRFDATQALEDVSLTLYPGEVHALLGENGAGKSTLIKIITGVYQPDRGEILLAGKPVTIRSAAEAQRLGVAAIYQEPLLFPDLTVAENIFVSHQDRGQVVGWRKMLREAEAILAELGVAIDVRSPARGLTLAAQQSVEIAKAISLNVRVLIMDEPTASLVGARGRASSSSWSAISAIRASPSSSSATASKKCSRLPTRSRSSATGG